MKISIKKSETTDKQIAVLNGRIKVGEVYDGKLFLTGAPSATEIHYIKKFCEKSNLQLSAKPKHLEHLGLMIKEIRKQKKRTQEQLANECALRTATISDIEAGKANFQINTLVRIASALNCYLDISFTPVK